MAARQSAVFRTTGATNNTPAFEIIAGGSRGFKLLEMEIILAAATASTYSLGRPAAKGVNPTTPLALLSDDNADAAEGQTRIAGAWGTPPTIPARFYRQVSFPATISSSKLWSFTNGLWVPPGATLVLWNSAANGVIDVSITVTEAY